MRPGASRAVPGVLLAALAAAGCGDGDESRGASSTDSPPAREASAATASARPTALETTPTEAADPTTPVAGRYRFVKTPVAVYWNEENAHYYLYVRMNRPLPRKRPAGGGGQRGHLLLGEQIEGGWFLHGTVGGRKLCYAADYYREDGPPSSSLFPWKRGLRLPVTYELERKVRARTTATTTLKTAGAGRRALRALGCDPL